ncbi:MAG: hypothetical protein ING72_08030, partial [Methylobacterium sp.]|nr:hypothetical protein [Methylobacterium sp.]
MENQVSVQNGSGGIPEWAEDVTPDSAERLVASLSDIAIVVDGAGVIHDVV